MGEKVAIFSTARFPKLVGILCLAFLVSACESLSTIPNPVIMPNGEFSETYRHVPHAVTTPVRDLNVGVKPVPRQLKLLQNPFGTDRSTNCRAIVEEIRDLEHALSINHTQLNGPEFSHDTRAGYAGEAAHDAVTAAVTSLIPYRGAVRYISGAKRREKEGIAADRIGRQRLGFLIGLGAERRCPGFHPKNRIRVRR